MNWNVLKSIFRRDFVSYFSSPTGYVFICVFVVLSALATFWPPEFFASNLANLDQLSRWLPFIMLVFIPAITMSIWAEERRQGTDELLLTAPASDIDVVLGKYLAGVAIFTVSLLFSAFAIFLVFNWGLGSPDGGLFVSTFIGYWFIGLAMIAIGMVASFLTDNLTVGFILGTLFNLPLALFGVSDWFVKNPNVAQFIRRWSALEQFRDFERGVISLGGVTYFVIIAVVMIYLSMVLIGRRHWQAREDGGALLGHYLVRTLCLLCLAVGVTEIIQNRNWLRADISSEHLSSLSEDTLHLLKQIREDEDTKTIKIDAYVSPQVPAEYTSTKLNFLSTLAELKALGRGKIQVTKHEIENYGAEALLAEETYDITPQEITITTGNERKQEEFFLAAAITSGTGKVVIPFLDKGIPVEYELVRSIVTVAQEKTPRVGIVDTGIPFFNPSKDRESEWPLITELRKQYDIDDEPVDPAKPIKDKYDVLLVVQPSMLGPQEMDHLVDAVRSGIPTAIMEDPHPHFFPDWIAATAEPRRQPGMMGMFGGGGTIPKGDLEQLWRTLGVEMDPLEVVWQDYEPEQTIRSEQDWQWIFVDQGNGAVEPFNIDSVISSGLNQLLLIYPGNLSKSEDSKLAFDELAVTGSKNSGTVDKPQLRRAQQNIRVFGRLRSSRSHILAARIQGSYSDDDLLLTDTTIADSLAEPASEESAESLESENAESTSEEREINAVVVSDVDWLIPAFFAIRQRGGEDILPATQNVTFILNIIDELAGDERFIGIRKRTRKHRTLTRIDNTTKSSREAALKEEEEKIKEFEEKLGNAQKRYREAVEAVEKTEGLSSIAKQQQKQAVEAREQTRLDAEIEAINADRSRKLKQIRYKMEQDIRGVQDRYKMYAILVPPIPPLLVALYVFFRRRETERESISKARLR
ncbi:MAG: Gldg family protein [Pirellulales bacterium]|nr:Gldg family protein [Pirellulales bacterium]